MKKTILLVEDSQDDALLMRKAIERGRLPVSLFFADSSQAAMEYLSGAGKFSDRRSFPLPDLILTDLSLGRQSGVELVSWIRAQDLLRRLPVVGFTAMENQTVIDRAYDCQISSFVVKPTSFSGLVATLSSLIHFWCSVNRGPALTRPSAPPCDAFYSAPAGP